MTTTGDGVIPDDAKQADGVHPNAAGKEALRAALSTTLAGL